jgi:hypothetical protein
MNAISESPNLGDLLKYEEDCLNYSREVATVAAGQNLRLGAVVGRDTLTGKLKALNPAATDGTETPVGILLGNVDASLIDVDNALLLNRHAVVASNAVIWPVEITTGHKAAAVASLASIGILIRQSA